MSWLAKAAGLDGLPSTTPGIKVLAFLETQAGLFLAAGGVVTPEWWLELEVYERAAFVAAGEKRDAEQALMLAQAMRGQTTEIMRRLGGERARTREILAQEAAR